MTVDEPLAAKIATESAIEELDKAALRLSRAAEGTTQIINKYSNVSKILGHMEPFRDFEMEMYNYEFQSDKPFSLTDIPPLYFVGQPSNSFERNLAKLHQLSMILNETYDLIFDISGQLKSNKNNVESFLSHRIKLSSQEYKQKISKIFGEFQYILNTRDELIRKIGNIERMHSRTMRGLYSKVDQYYFDYRMQSDLGNAHTDAGNEISLLLDLRDTIFKIGLEDNFYSGFLHTLNSYVDIKYNYILELIISDFENEKVKKPNLFEVIIRKLIPAEKTYVRRTSDEFKEGAEAIKGSGSHRFVRPKVTVLPELNEALKDAAKSAGVPTTVWIRAALRHAVRNGIDVDYELGNEIEISDIGSEP